MSLTTKEIIRREFLKLYTRLPLYKIKVSQLIEVCPVTRGTFYFHFANVDEVYKECERDLIERLEVGLDTVNLSTVRQHYHKHLKVYEKYLEKYVSMQDEIRVFLTGSEAMSFQRAFLDSVAVYFGECVQYTLDTDDVMQRLLTRFFAGGHTDLIMNWVLEGCKEKPNVIAAACTQMIYKGALVPNENQLNSNR